VKSKSPRRYRQYDRNRLEILQSAARAFSRNGFHSATMQDIGERIRMAKGNLYYYFRSKQELLFFCQHYSLDRMLEEARKIVARKQSADVQLGEIIRAQLRCMLDKLQGSAAHLEFRDLPSRLLEQIVEKRDRYEKLLRDVVKRGIRQGVFRDCNIRAAVWATLGALNWTAQWYSPEGPMSVDQIAAEFSDYLVRGLIKSTGRRVRKSAGPQVGRSAGPQVRRSTGRQVGKSTGQRVNKLKNDLMT
jgi:AcrR family transcriptional regulator